MCLPISLATALPTFPAFTSLRRVEKTPRHVNHLKEIFRLDPTAKVVFIVRDGRDVAASLQKRGFPWKDCTGRWVGPPVPCLPGGRV